MPREKGEVLESRIESGPSGEEETEARSIELPEIITVRGLADLMGISPIDVIKELMRSGIMANINQSIDRETASIVVEDMGFRVKEELEPEPEEQVVLTRSQAMIAGEDPAKLKPRPPVVAVLGHVDHGKTTLLDAIRRTQVAAGEAGGITQHIGAYQVESDGRRITFLDTPGHEAFTAMRARGANATDIVVLVVATDDGVQPQTIEAVNHARAAHVPIVVALNKIDREIANPELVKQQLAEIDLIPEEWGGSTICVPVSAQNKIGLDTLLDMILLVADLNEFKANPDRPAMGTVIEAQLDRSRGPIATLLVQNGTLEVGDSFLVEEISGRVRAMLNERGERISRAGPSIPVVVLGFSSVPPAGSIFEVMPDGRQARALAEERAAKKRMVERGPSRILSLEDFFEQMQSGRAKELLLILKADAQGPLEAARDSLAKLGGEETKVNIIHEAVGLISESDVMLATASQAVIIGFGVGVDPVAQNMANANGVEIRTYDVIYELLDEVEKALQGLLEPEYEEVLIGKAEVRAIFHIPNRGKVAGVYVVEGTAARNATVHVVRAGDIVHQGLVASLRRFTQDVREVASGYECGVGLEGFQDFQEGDIIEFYLEERLAQPPAGRVGVPSR